MHGGFVSSQMTGAKHGDFVVVGTVQGGGVVTMQFGCSVLQGGRIVTHGGVYTSQGGRSVVQLAVSTWHSISLTTQGGV